MKWNKEKDVLALMVGHGKSLDGTWDPGCVYGSYTEADLMFQIVKSAVHLLRKSGVKVLTDYDTKNDKNMKASVALANQKKARLYMSVHCDYAPAASGIMYYYASAAGKKLGDHVCKYLAKAMDMKFKGGVKDPQKYEVGQTNMTAVLLETGAIKADLAKLKEYASIKKGAKKYGRSLAKAILKYIGVPVYVTKQTKLARREAAILAYANLNHFKYTKKYKDCAKTWKGAKKLKKMNCSCAMSYAAQEEGLLDPGQIFWFSIKKIVCKGKGTKAKIKKNFKIIRPNKAPKKAGMKKGDFTCSGRKHTQAYGGWKGDHPTWYSWGPNDVGKKQPRHKKSYDSRKVTIIMRPK